MHVWMLQSACWASKVTSDIELPAYLPRSGMESVGCVILLFFFFQVPLEMTGLKKKKWFVVYVFLSYHYPPPQQHRRKNDQTADGTIRSPGIYSFLPFLSIT